LRSISPELVDRAVETVRSRPTHNGELAKVTQLIEKLLEFRESDDLDSMDVLEFLQRFSGLGLTAQDLLETLSPIRPRLYSIASSQSVYPHQVHLTVGRVENDIRGRVRKGVASTMLSDRMHSNVALPVFVQPSHGFTIPSDPNAPMIMVGPGTGIAPFMAFLQQREVDRATGMNWLFFGDQRRDFDFLYEDQLEKWRVTGLLTRLDLAFSRDGTEKLYVQHRMRENGKELFRWLERGGYVFVCGDASRMAVDVDRALAEIIEQYGQRTPDQAKQYLADLTKSKRYVRDVY
jgi:sulfite reductase (NADPH) flavoprotein alpha-component